MGKLSRNTPGKALAWLDGDLIPFAKVLGMRFTVAGPERVVAELTVREDLCTAGTVLNLPEGAAATTIESKTNFMAAVPSGTVVTGEATPVHRGRTTMVWQTRATTAEGRLAALVTQTQMVLPPRQ